MNQEGFKDSWLLTNRALLHMFTSWRHQCGAHQGPMLGYSLFRFRTILRNSVWLYPIALHTPHFAKPTPRLKITYQKERRALWTQELGRMFIFSPPYSHPPFLAYLQSVWSYSETTSLWPCTQWAIVNGSPMSHENKPPTLQRVTP